MKAVLAQRVRLRRRLRPLYAVTFLLNVAFWVPIEKLFLTGIGFDIAMIGVMAALYAGAVPLIEVPSGILADRWSRRGVLAIAVLALAVSVTIGGLSTNVPTYLVAAFFLGVFFAMHSGTMDSLIYDTVLEETGNSESFERSIGRVRLLESLALVAGALTGGLLAELAPLRVTYFVTVPFVAAAGIGLWRFREPRLHEVGERQPLRRQVATTFRTILERGRLRPVVALIVLSSVLLQAMFEFGPLWMVALAVPAIVYGPHWAGLTAALGLGGLLGSRRAFTRLWTLVGVGVTMVACCAVLVASRAPVTVVLAQVALATLMVAIGIPAMRRLHDGVPSTIRAGVASGVSTLTWLTFMVFSLVFGALSDRSSVYAAGWILTGVAAGAAVLLVATLRGVKVEPPPPVPVPEPEPVPVVATAAGGTATESFGPERFLPADHPEFPGHWAIPPRAWELDIRPDDDGALAEARAAIRDLPAPLRRVIVLRDIEGLSPGDTSEALDLSPDTERALLHRARSLVRVRLERYIEERNA